MSKLFKRAMLYGTLVVFFVSLFLLADSINYLKKPLVGQDNVQQHMNELGTCLLNREWAEANGELEGLNIAWTKVQKRVQFAGESDDIKKIDELLVRLEMAIRIKSYDIANTDMASLKFHWGHIGK